MTKQRLISQNLSEIGVSAGILDVANIKNLVQKENPIILEIGANCGQTTIDFVQHFPNAIIHCFEPDPRAIKKFKRLVNHPNVFLHEIAIGNSNGTITFHQSAGGEAIDPEGWDHSGSIRAPKAHLEMFPWVRFDNKIEVPIMRLDDWANQHGIDQVDFIWADVQGAEGDMINGAFETLKKTRFIYTEYYNNECYDGQIALTDIYALLNQFLIIAKYENDVLLENFLLNQKLPSNLLQDFINKALKSENSSQFFESHGAASDFFEKNIKGIKND
jgi:2-O-methyltransferase